MKVLSITSVPYWIKQGEWNMVFYCLNPKHWEFETWGYIIVGLEFTWLTWFFIRMCISAVRQHRAFKAECESKGQDWRVEDWDLIVWRNLLRTFGLKFLIRKKYRNLKEL
jgi:hypothetical protein